MADLGEAFNILKTQNNIFQHMDYFFTQRNLTEEQEYLDKKSMKRKTKKIKSNHNFLALNIPTIISTTNVNGQQQEKTLGFDIEIFGDEGYHYKGSITSHQGNVPSLMIPVKTDKKLFVHVNYKISDNDNVQSKKFVNFIEVPKRFQTASGDDVSEINKNEENEEDV